MIRSRTIIAMLLPGIGFAAATAAQAAELGSDAKPVLADMPPGQRAYLDRLRCADGNAPAYQRVGNIGPGPDGHIVDLYDVTCDGSEPARTGIHIDMYHRRHVEDEAVPGFTIVPG